MIMYTLGYLLFIIEKANFSCVGLFFFTLMLSDVTQS